ncbi:MAG: hypothetical protein QOJ39_1291, partial [Candidatus Eremiobacteraeota bacterium]|nr:hypothetical protein [Candidatus Eremiobacteraeota bacterium]
MRVADVRSTLNGFFATCPTLLKVPVVNVAGTKSLP